MPASRRPAPLGPALVLTGLLLAGLAGWVGIAALVASGSGGLVILAAILLAPPSILAMQTLRMRPDQRRALPVPLSDRGDCPFGVCSGGATEGCAPHR